MIIQNRNVTSAPKVQLRAAEIAAGTQLMAIQLHAQRDIGAALLKPLQSMSDGYESAEKAH